MQIVKKISFSQEYIYENKEKFFSNVLSKRISLQSYICERKDKFKRFSWGSSDNGRVIGNSILQSNNVYDRNSSSKCTPLLYGARVDSTRTTTSAKLRHVGIVADCRRQSNKTRAISRFCSDQCV